MSKRHTETTEVNENPVGNDNVEGQGFVEKQPSKADVDPAVADTAVANLDAEPGEHVAEEGSIIESNQNNQNVIDRIESEEEAQRVEEGKDHTIADQLRYQRQIDEQIGSGQQTIVVKTR